MLFLISSKQQCDDGTPKYVSLSYNLKVFKHFVYRCIEVWLYIFRVCPLFFVPCAAYIPLPYIYFFIEIHVTHQKLQNLFYHNLPLHMVYVVYILYTWGK